MASRSTAGASLASRDDIVIHTFQPDIDIDVEKLAQHSELFSANPSGHYTFPEGSGTAGTLSWKLPAQSSSSSITAYEHITCVDCLAICATTAIIPLGWIA
ncbi:hypothetical protein F5B19DRAFT_491732 [Rostrohypoxylon terebratum]|nr:hypothetical protein F5B19DRAFT_491732 [Rostrohypoxylon terebratum]